MNATYREKTAALGVLRLENKAVIILADKGNASVVLDHEGYDCKVMDLLWSHAYDGIKIPLELGGR